MTKEERRVKKYIDAWIEGKRVWYKIVSNRAIIWEEIDDIFQLLRVFHNGLPLRIVKGKRV